MSLSSSIYEKIIKRFKDDSTVVENLSQGIFKKDRLSDVLACPNCLSSTLKITSEKVLCTACGSSYPVRKNTPIFLDEGIKYMDRTLQEGRTNPYTKEALEIISRNRDGLILDVGAGYPEDKYQFANVVYQDLLHFPITDVVSSARHLPFKDNTFDGVVSLSVFEHVKDPFNIANEIYRVCKPGGEIYIDTAFMQPYHADPDHYYNMTISGLENLFRKFRKIDSGVGPHQKASYTVRLILDNYRRFSTDQEINERIDSLLKCHISEQDFKLNDECHYRIGAGVFFRGIKE